MSKRALHPSLKTAHQILRLLEPLTIEARRTVLHFVHQSVEESFQEECRVGLTEAGLKVAAEAQARMLQADLGGTAKNGQATA